MQGFQQILMGPAHPPYERFIVAPGHQMGFNDLKIIEAHELLNRIAGKPALTIDFEAGLAIERTIHAIARSSREGRWVDGGLMAQILRWRLVQRPIKQPELTEVV